MAMMDLTELRTTMRTQLKTVTTLPSADRRAWENRTFRPPEVRDQPGADVMWVREQIRILSETKSSTGFIEAIGETLYMVHYPAGRGTGPMDELTLAIAEAFQAGQSLTGTGLTAILEHTERRPPRVDPTFPSWIFTTVAVRWRSFTAI